MKNAKPKKKKLRTFLRQSVQSRILFQGEKLNGSEKQQLYSITKMLVSAQKTDPKSFWKCISRAKGKMATFSNIDPKAFLSHFANLNMSSENDRSLALPQSATPSPYIPELDG